MVCPNELCAICTMVLEMWRTSLQHTACSCWQSLLGALLSMFARLVLHMSHRGLKGVELLLLIPSLLIFSLSMFAGALAGSLQKWRWRSQSPSSSHTLKCNLSAVKTVMDSLAVLRLSTPLCNTSRRVQHFQNLGTLTGCFHELKQGGKLASDGQWLHAK